MRSNLKLSAEVGEQNAGTAGTGGTGQQPIPAGSKPQQRKYFYWVFVLTVKTVHTPRHVLCYWLVSCLVGNQYHLIKIIQMF